MIRAGTRTLLVCGAAALTILAMTGTPTAGASHIPTAFETTELKQQLLIPPGFQLQGSNGFSVFVLGLPAQEGHPAKVGIFVSGRHAGVDYSAPATVTETSIQANLGQLGEISVTFHPSGQPRTVQSQCGGKPLSFDSGNYEGKIDFRGEEGYTEAEAASAPGSLGFLLDVVCSGASVQSGGPFLPGAELRVRNPQLGPELSVIKNRPDAAALFGVGVSEYREGISVERLMSLRMSARTFRYDSRLQTATVRPPAPFAGTAQFDRRRKANRRWSGDLTVDMPGRADVPLTGSKLRATLIHAQWGRHR